MNQKNFSERWSAFKRQSIYSRSAINEIIIDSIYCANNFVRRKKNRKRVYRESKAIDSRSFSVCFLLGIA